MTLPTFGSAGAVDAGTITSGAAWDPVCPAVVNAGDLLIAHVSCRNLTSTPTTPAGWTLLTGPHATSVGRHWLFGKIADGTEDGAAISFGTQAVAVNRSGRIYCFTGNDWTGQNVADIVLGFAHGTNTGTQIADTAVTTPIANCLACNFVKSEDNNSVVAFTGETGGDWIEAVAEATNNIGTGWTAQLQIADMASPGTIDGGTLSTSLGDPWGNIGCYIREPIPPTSTSVARISLAPGSVPVTRTQHSIKVRARVTGGTGTIWAALYEGATNRSGDLESSALTGSLANYTLPIADADAEDITDYSDLEIRFWGYSAVGAAATFEVDQIWLEIPEASAAPPAQPNKFFALL